MATVERLRITKESDGITVRIKPKTHWPVLFSIALSLASWIYGGILAMNALSNVAVADASFELLFLSFWGAVGALPILAFLWNVFGEEIISIRNGLFTRKLALGGFGKKKTFPANELFNLRPWAFSMITTER